MDQEAAVDSPISDAVVHVDVRKTWTDAVFASLGSNDRHVSDDEIFALLTTASDGGTAADLCAAKGVTVPMYCVWKAKYRGLNLEELRTVRRGELSRARRLVGMLIAAAALGAGGIVFGLARAAQADPTVAMEFTPAPLAPMAINSAPLRDGAVAPAPAEARVRPIADGSRDSVSSRSAATPVGPAAPAPTTEPQYNIQVAAAVSLQEGRVLVERLAAAGYPAYVVTAVVSNVEVFRVRVGPFDTLEETKPVSRQLQRNGYAGAWIVR
jgi:cell division septation protein DedD